MAEPTLYLFHANKPLVLATGQMHRIRVVAPRLESNLPLEQLAGIASIFEKPAFTVWLRGSYGSDIPQGAYHRLFADLRAGSVVMPALVLKRELPQGHLAAYDAGQEQILISHRLLEGALDEANPDGCFRLVAALLEEFGHHIDTLLRTRYSSVGGDARFDEGARFAYALLNLSWDAREQGEVARLVYPFGSRALLANWSAYKRSISRFVGPDQQRDDDRWRQYEFFGAGVGKANKHNHGHSYGHQSIEHALLGAAEVFQQEGVPGQVYFGNWLRDFSQVITPLPLKVLSREMLTKLIDFRARTEFGDKEHFRVTPEMLGVYRTEEHLDNPYGLEDGTSADPALNRSYLEEQCEIDAETWMQKHLKSSVAGCTSGFENIKAWLERSMASQGPERFRHFGAALHALEDYYAHSNFLEVMLIELGYRGVYPWTKSASVRRGGQSLEVFPIVTGCFGGLDTAASLILEIGEDMQKLVECVPGKRTGGAELTGLVLRDLRPSWAARYEALLKLKNELAVEMPWFDKIMCESIDALVAMVHFAIGGAVRLMGNQIDEAQVLFLSDPDSHNPTHTQVAKDHDDHPLHELAAGCASLAVAHVGRLMSEAWTGTGSLQRVVEGVSQFMSHPAHIRPESPAWAVRVRVANWAAANRSTVQKLATRSWVEEASKSAEWQEFRARAATLTEAWDATAAEAERARKLGLEAYARETALRFQDVSHSSMVDLQSRATDLVSDLHELAEEKKRELTRAKVQAAEAEYRALLERKIEQLCGPAWTRWSEFERAARAELAKVRSAEVQEAYRDRLELELERTMQQLHTLKVQHERQLETAAQREVSRLEELITTIDPAKLVSARVAAVQSMVDAAVKKVREDKERVVHEFEALAEEVRREMSEPPPATAFQELLEREALLIRQKLEQLVDSVLPALPAPPGRVEVRSFIEARLSELRAVHEQVIEDARQLPERERIAQALERELEQFLESLDARTEEVSRRAAELAEELKPKIKALEHDLTDDLQLSYLRELRASTRGIERKGAQH